MCAAMRLICATLIVLVVSPDMGFAMNAGLGAFTCFQFATAYGEDQASEYKYFAWAQGYMSALSAARSDKAVVDLDPLSFDVTDQMDFMLSYCATNPSRTYASGIDRLYARLQRKLQ
jgi:hypothetical protein